MQHSLTRMRQRTHLGTALLTMIAHGTRQTVVEIVPNTNNGISKETTEYVHGTDESSGIKGRGGVRNSVTKASDPILDSKQVDETEQVTRRSPGECDSPRSVTHRSFVLSEGLLIYRYPSKRTVDAEYH